VVSAESCISHKDLAEKTDGYSGADIYVLCKEAAMCPMRRILATTSFQDLKQRREEGSLNVPEVTTDLLYLR